MSVGGISLSSSLHGRDFASDYGSERADYRARPLGPPIERSTGASLRGRLSQSQVLGTTSLFHGMGPSLNESAYRPSVPSAVYSSYHGPPSSNGSDQATRHVQFGQDTEYAARKQTMLRHEYERMQNEEAARAQLQHEIHESKFQTDKLRSTLTGIGREGGPVAKMQEDYRTYRGIMEEREEAYRQVWRQEEDRVKNVSEDTKTRLKIVRDHLIGTLDQVDVSNRSMLDAMDELMKVDVDMCREHGDPIPHEMSSFAVNAAPMMGQGVSMVNVAPVMGQGVSMMGLDLKSSRGGLLAPGQGQGVSMLGLDLGKKGEMPDSPQHGGVVVTADVIQPVTNTAGMASDKEFFRQQLIDAGFVRASQDISNIA